MSISIQKYGHCSSCGKCWCCVKPHVVMVEAKSGVGILCLKCWDDLPAPERINLHYEFWLMQLKWWQLLLVLFHYPGAAAGWKRLRRAIGLDSVQEWQGYCQGCGEFSKIVGMAAKVCRVCGKRLQERIVR